MIEMDDEAAQMLADGKNQYKIHLLSLYLTWWCYW